MCVFIMQMCKDLDVDGSSYSSISKKKLDINFIKVIFYLCKVGQVFFNLTYHKIIDHPFRRKIELVAITK